MTSNIWSGEYSPWSWSIKFCGDWDYDTKGQDRQKVRNQGDDEMKDNLITIFTFIIAMLLATIVFFEILNGCRTLESYCYDYTNGSWNSNIELDHSICQNNDLCNDYCKKTYGTEVDWSTCCWTDGDVPDSDGRCVNIQMCKCLKGGSQWNYRTSVNS